MSEIKKYIKKITDGNSLTIEETTRAFQIMLTGGAMPSQVAAFLAVLKAKGEDTQELIGAMRVLKAKSIPVNAPNNNIDICNVGPHTYNLLNVHTAVAFIVAGCGIPVAKHGSRITTESLNTEDMSEYVVRAAGILPILGINISANAKIAEKALIEANICFMLINKFHSYVRDIIQITAELGINTIFDTVIPLCNPANPKYRLIGVHSADIAQKLAVVLQSTGCKKAWITTGHNGLASLTLTGESYVTEVTSESIKSFTINPEDLELPKLENLEDIEGGDIFFNAKRLSELLQGKVDNYRNIALLNAAAALVVSGAASNLKDGLQLAINSLDCGKAHLCLKKLVEISSL